MTDTHTTAAAGGTTSPGRPARPPRPAGWWERIDRIVNQAPPLSDEQRAVIRVAIHGTARPARAEAA